MNNFTQQFSKRWRVFYKTHLKAENVVEISKVIALLSIFVTISVFSIKFLVQFAIRFFDRHPIISICLALAVICIIEKIVMSRPEKESLPPKMSQSKRQQAYLNLRTLVYKAFNSELSDVLDVYPPNRLTDLEPPETISKRNGIIFFHFILVAKDTTIDVDTAHSLIEDRINSLARAGKSGLDVGKNILINGKAYPPIQLHSCDVTGRYMSLCLVFTSKEYIEQMEEELMIDIANGFECDIYDSDDDEF